MIRFVQALTFLKAPTKALTYVGSHSLLLMCVHAIEDSNFSFWLDMNPTIAVFLRIAVDVLVMAVLNAIFTLVRNRRKEG